MRPPARYDVLTAPHRQGIPEVNKIMGFCFRMKLPAVN